MSFSLDNIINRVRKGQIIEEEYVVSILDKMKEVFFLENNLLQLNSPIIICGDVHGQLDDVIYLFDIAGDISNQKFLFMGDYVDRGYFSINTFLLLICYKLKYRKNFYLLRGNHESRQVSFKYGLYSETIAYYGHPGIWFLMNDLFDLLPLAAIIDNTIFAVHGGLSPDLTYLSQIQDVDRMAEVLSDGLIADLLWSDPDDVKKWIPNSRGSGFIFGQNQTQKFLHDNKLKKITRAHQLANEGYKYYFPEKEKKPSTFNIDDDDSEDGYNTKTITKNSISEYVSDGSEGRLLLVWSAPNYMYTSNNKASILKYNYDGDGQYRLIIFNPSPERLSQGGTREGGTTSYFV